MNRFRAFFAVIAFVLMGGSIITAIIPIGSRGGLHHDDVTGLIIGSIACFSWMIFAIRKTTPVKRVGFWRESARPFFQSLFLVGLGGRAPDAARLVRAGHARAPACFSSRSEGM